MSGRSLVRRALWTGVFLWFAVLAWSGCALFRGESHEQAQGQRQARIAEKKAKADVRAAERASQLRKDQERAEQLKLEAAKTEQRTRELSLQVAAAQARANSVTNLAGRPRIHNIGSSAILQFDPGKVLDIPIEGQDLLDPFSAIAVSLPSPLVDGDDYEVRRSDPGRLFVRVKGSATTNLNTGDPLTVSVTITERTSPPGTEMSRLALAEMSALSFNVDEVRKQISEGRLDKMGAAMLGRMVALARFDTNYVNGVRAWLNQGPKTEPGSSNALVQVQEFEQGYSEGSTFMVNPQAIQRAPLGKLLASESRTFVLFTRQDYRTRILAHHIDIQNITAFPLPEEEAIKLFGSFVARHFYALRLTLRNPTDKDQLVSLGMIKAYGRALVTTTPDVGPPFTKPIEVAPQSQQQVYAMVLNGKSSLPREWFFRTLDLVGALATAASPAYGASSDLIKAIAIATGTGIPGLRTLWVDSVPFHLQNIVNFAMPDLIKVPKGGSVDGKYLFFSRDRLLAVIQDPLVAVAQKSLGPKTKSFDFSAVVVSLSFDTLQIPFENTTSSTEGELATEVDNLKTRVGTALSVYAKLRGDWNESTGTIGELTAGDFIQFQRGLTNALAAVANMSGYTNATALRDALLSWQTNATVLKPQSLLAMLFDSPIIGSAALSTSLSTLQQVEAGMLQGKPASLYAATVDHIAKTVQTAEAQLAFVEAVAEVIVRDALPGEVAKVNADANQEVLDGALEVLTKSAARLPKAPALAKER